MSQGTVLVPDGGKWRSAEVPEPGEYMDPDTEMRFRLNGFLGSHSGPGYAMSGWPTHWERLIPVADEEQR